MMDPSNRGKKCNWLRNFKKEFLSKAPTTKFVNFLTKNNDGNFKC